ncbi:hypothetical protein AB6D57_25430, partial [Vibrio splendidus]
QAWLRDLCIRDRDIPAFFVLVGMSVGLSENTERQVIKKADVCTSTLCCLLVSVLLFDAQ